MLIRGCEHELKRDRKASPDCLIQSQGVVCIVPISRISHSVYACRCLCPSTSDCLIDLPCFVSLTLPHALAERTLHSRRTRSNQTCRKNTRAVFLFFAFRLILSGCTSPFSRLLTRSHSNTIKEQNISKRAAREPR